MITFVSDDDWWLASAQRADEWQDVVAGRVGAADRWPVGVRRTQPAVVVEAVALVGMHAVRGALPGRMPVPGREDQVHGAGRVRRLRDVGRPERVPDRVAAGATGRARGHTGRIGP